MTHLVILSGASGVGKTTLAEALVQTNHNWGHVHPDGLWDTLTLKPERIFEMVVEFAIKLTQETVVVDCQLHPASIASIVGHRPVSWNYYLLDCPTEIREKRLLNRGWSGEDFPKITTWQSVLKSGAEELDYMILDTNAYSTVELVQAVKDDHVT